VTWAESPKTKISKYVRIAAVHLGGNFVSAQLYTQSGHPLDPIPGEAVRKDGLYMMYFLRTDAGLPPVSCDVDIPLPRRELEEEFSLCRFSEAVPEVVSQPDKRAGVEIPSSRASSVVPIHPSRQLAFQGPRGGNIAEKVERRPYSPPSRNAPRGPGFRRREEKRQHRFGQDTYLPSYTDQPRRQRSRSRVDSRWQARARDDNPRGGRSRSRGESPPRRRPRSRSESPRRRRHRSRSGSPRRRRDRSMSESPRRRRDRSRGETHQRERRRLRSRTHSRGPERELSERDERRPHGRSRAKEPRLHRESSERLSLGSPRDVSDRRQTQEPSRRHRSPTLREPSVNADTANRSRHRTRAKPVPSSHNNAHDGPESPGGLGGVSG